MKQVTRLAIIIGMVALSAPSYAKQEAGIYLTATDYQNQKLSYRENCKLHLHNTAWYLPYLTVIENGSKQKLYKSELFGYVDHENNTYRFYKGQEYLMAEPGPIYIYTQREYADQYKAKRNVMIKYFFSSTAGGPILPLNIENLKFAFPNNEKFQDLLDQFFGNNNVIAFDKAHHTFKVNYVYRESLQTNK